MGNIGIGILIIAGILLGGTIAGGAIAGKNSYDNGNRGWDLAKDVIFGGSVGLATAGLSVALFSVGLGAFSVTTFLGMSTLQIFAIGAIAFDFNAFVIAPIFGIEMQGIEFQESGNRKYDTQPDISYPSVEKIGYKKISSFFNTKVFGRHKNKGSKKWIIETILYLTGSFLK